VRRPEDLKGRTVFFYRTERSPCGWRSGRVRSVTVKRDQLHSVLVSLPGDRKDKRRRARVTLAELTMPNQPVGVKWRGRIVPYAEWMEAK
jgi:hypothetical protein